MAERAAAGEFVGMVLVSDGGANVGVTEADLIGAEAGAYDEDGTYLVGVGVGDLGTYNDTLMDTVTDLGRGAALFVGSTDEAWRMLDERFDEVMDVAVRDVEVRLDLPPGFEIVRTSAEAVSACAELSRARAEGDFRPQRSCSRLQDSIRTAVRDGAVEVGGTVD